jgi:hypothetical protein
MVMTLAVIAGFIGALFGSFLGDWLIEELRYRWEEHKSEKSIQGFRASKVIYDEAHQFISGDGGGGLNFKVHDIEDLIETEKRNRQRAMSLGVSHKDLKDKDRGI